MIEVADVRRRVQVMIERARQAAADRRARASVADEQARQFMEDIARPVMRQVLLVLKSEGYAYRLSTPAVAARLVSEKHHEDFIDLSVDTTQDPIVIMTLVSHIRGQRVSTTERPLGPGVALDQLTDEHVFEFLLDVLPVFVER